MKIVYTLPSISTPHGGYRIVLEHLTRLQSRGHDVSLFIQTGLTNTDWYGKVDFDITKNPAILRNRQDVIVLGSPHAMGLNTAGNRVVCFVQMAEHLFNPANRRFRNKCEEWYSSQYDKFYGSAWIGRLLRGKLHYLPDGINTDHFPVETNVPKDGRTLLVEGWEASNHAKDIDRIGPNAAAILKHQYGFKILAYGFQSHNHIDAKVLDEYHYRPDLETMNDLYRRSSLLLKATRYDSRALSPMEAATKECLTVRALNEGDDHLTNNFNCLRTSYHWDSFRVLAEKAAVMSDWMRRQLAGELKIEPWEPIIDEIENKFLNL